MLWKLTRANPSLFCFLVALKMLEKKYGLMLEQALKFKLYVENKRMKEEDVKGDNVCSIWITHEIYFCF